MNGTPRIDLTGKRFGHLTALEYIGGPGCSWACVCDCGAHRGVRGGDLRSGGTTSCGCMTSELKSMGNRLKGLAGQRFGRLVVVEFAQMRASESFWLCRCDCGSAVEVRGWMLRDGSTQSCGCLHREVARANRTTSPTYSAVHSRLRTTRGSASGYLCVDCGGRAEQWSYDHRDPSALMSAIGHPYSTNLDHYEPRCCSCHRKFDVLNQEARC